jgi:phage shock protein A
MSTELNQSILAAALEGFEGQLAKLEEQISFVKSKLSGKKQAKAPAAAPKAVKPAKGKGKKGRAVSEEGRQRMAEAQKRRWAKVHAAKRK